MPLSDLLKVSAKLASALGASVLYQASGRQRSNTGDKPHIYQTPKSSLTNFDVAKVATQEDQKSKS